ncbi:MAG: NAD(P)-dependent oxidoreductase [Lachnospiraceae bacterium]
MSELGIPYFPMFVNLESKQVVVFGAGKIAFRRIQTLLLFHASIVVIARDISKDAQEGMKRLIKTGQIRFVQKEFEEEDLTMGIDIVIAATDDSGLNEVIYDLCKERKIIINVATNPQLCDFYFPAVAMQDGIIIGITGNGQNHKKVLETAKEIRKYLENTTDESDLPIS